ncbi:hypothetical protein CAPTEDRAFT_194303 [Capitella teleta]|uniref:Uncharacterized protein n=1 Tax=Capitella teleta TaxID=283909 RepID=R7UGX5_CAPTE|nr:hypothetical protein CAPTEDRAFT_194303 [Capitella teleta]|eukprot:ELU02512.1 hypothetical protein CAPTEDRAFT_194303 [Capitella teleta]
MFGLTSGLMDRHAPSSNGGLRSVASSRNKLNGTRTKLSATDCLNGNHVSGSHSPRKTKINRDSKNRKPEVCTTPPHLTNGGPVSTLKMSAIEEYRQNSGTPLFKDKVKSKEGNMNLVTYNVPHSTPAHRKSEKPVSDKVTSSPLKSSFGQPSSKKTLSSTPKKGMLYTYMKKIEGGMIVKGYFMEPSLGAPSRASTGFPEHRRVVSLGERVQITPHLAAGAAGNYSEMDALLVHRSRALIHYRALAEGYHSKSLCAYGQIQEWMAGIQERHLLLEGGSALENCSVRIH